MRRAVIARRSDGEPAPEADAGVMEVLAKAPVLLRADARAAGGSKVTGGSSQVKEGTVIAHLVMRARSSGVESVRDFTFCERGKKGFNRLVSCATMLVQHPLT